MAIDFQALGLHPGIEAQINAAIVKGDKSVTIDLSPYTGQEYPKHLYKGNGTKDVFIARNKDEEDKASKNGYGKFKPEPPFPPK